MYRNDISILRAVSVLSVMFFHAKIPYFEGGYLGVDVFFVLSGFLIYGNITKSIIEKNFSFKDFYISRARRLLPALILVVGLTLLCGIAILLPYDLKNLGQSIVATVLSANNVLLYITSGYWDAVSDFKPLYHTWSLAVEEQFYIVGPIAFYIIFNYFNSRFARVALYSVLLLSSYLVFVLADNREYSFLMTHSRAWELLAGVVAYEISTCVSKNDKYRYIFAIFGWGLVITSIFIGRNFTAELAMLPVLGVCILLIFPLHADFWYAWYFRPFIYLGLISYSLYLWHQPVFAYLRYISVVEPSVSSFVVAIVVILVLAALTVKYIEVPFRIKSNFESKILIVSASISTAFLLLMGFLFNITYGFASYSKYDYGENPQKYVDGPNKLAFTKFESNSRQNNVLVLGNSFARDFINVLSFYSPASKFNIKYYKGGCDLIRGEDFKNDLQNSKYVFYSENWAQNYYKSSDVDDLNLCLQDILKVSPDSEVTIVGVKNFGWNNGFVKFNSVTSDYFVRPRESVNHFNINAAIALPGYLNLLDELKNVQGNVPIFDNDGHLLTYDTNHLTRNGAKHLELVLRAKLNKIFDDRL